MGIGHEGLLHKLLATEPTVILTKAITISRAHMISTCSTKQIIHTVSNPAGTVHRIAPTTDKTAERGSARGREHGPWGPGTQSPLRGANQAAPCWRCGGSHGAHQCRFAEYTCNTCHTKGHLQRMCKRNRTHHVAEEMGDYPPSSEEQAEDDEVLGLYTCTDDSPPVIREVKINGVPVSMEVDTGSGRSLMNRRTFDKLWINPAARPKLVPVTAKLRTYTRELIPVLGRAMVQVSHGDETHGLPLQAMGQHSSAGGGWGQSVGAGKTLPLHRLLLPGVLPCPGFPESSTDRAGAAASIHPQASPRPGP
uniref:uncharacterized protein n=1 Tax=Pristiophorus japonicus TaxID=55135 RepID=UPI00398EFDAC